MVICIRARCFGSLRRVKIVLLLVPVNTLIVVVLVVFIHLWTCLCMTGPTQTNLFLVLQGSTDWEYGLMFREVHIFISSIISAGTRLFRP